MDLSFNLIKPSISTFSIRLADYFESLDLSSSALYTGQTGTFISLNIFQDIIVFHRAPKQKRIPVSHGLSVMVY